MDKFDSWLLIPKFDLTFEFESMVSFFPHREIVTFLLSNNNSRTLFSWKFSFLYSFKNKYLLCFISRVIESQAPVNKILNPVWIWMIMCELGWLCRVDNICVP